MTTLEKLAHECTTAPKWNLAARCTRAWDWKLIGADFSETASHACSPARCLELAKAEFANLKPQGCLRLEVYLKDELVHVCE